MGLKKILVGTDDFEKIRKENVYYVDKTGFIAELMENCHEVNLFTRPRRFGKSLNMSMLRHFFEIGTDPRLFDGLAIMGYESLCREHMGQYPVIAVTLKNVSVLSFEDALEEIAVIISEEAIRHKRAMMYEKLSMDDKNFLDGLCNGSAPLNSSLLRLSRILSAYYNKPAVILIDEYDVPLQKAEQNGCYKQMTGFISTFFGSCLKSNTDLAFAVITGCLRISKESIFTGLNNVVVHSTVDEEFEEWFGFTNTDVKEVLDYYGCLEQFDIIKAWYDGYRFGQVEVYCPWDVMNWMRKFVTTGSAQPENYWIHTSGNQIITRFAKLADSEMRDELEILVQGGTVKKPLNLNITYDELENEKENLWGVLLTTGYLTQLGTDEMGHYELMIPNREIRDTFSSVYHNWFRHKVFTDTDALSEFFQAMDGADGGQMQICLNDYLEDSISYFDSSGKGDKESFYHGLILGMLKNRSDWKILSNRESGDGRFDIAACPRRGEFAVIFELKYAPSYAALGTEAKAALKQIDQKRYDSMFRRRRITSIIHYGIAFHKKECCVAAETVAKEEK